VTYVSFKFDDNVCIRGDIGIFSVDDIAIFSDITGMAQVLSIDFEF